MLHKASEEFGRTLGKFVDHVPALSPYVHVQFAPNDRGYASVYGQKLIKQIEQQRHLHPLIEAGLCDGDLGSLMATCETVDAAIGRIGTIGNDSARASISGNLGVLPDHFHIGNR